MSLFAGSKGAAEAPATPAVEGTPTGDNSAPRHCRCPLCGQIIVAKTQEECVEHMSSCTAFPGVHPGKGQPTNFDYFKKKEGESGTPSPTPSPVGTAAGVSTNNNPPVSSKTPEEISDMNVRALKSYISGAGLSHSDCVEKSDLQERAKEAATVVAAQESP